MKLFNIIPIPFTRSSAAKVAKERLQIIVSHESGKRTGPDFVQKLQAELIQVISKYIEVDEELIKVQLDRNGDHSVLELNVTLPANSPIAEAEATS